jgi:hypothetical protein
MEFDLFGVSVKDLCMQNMITKCNSLGPLYILCLPMHPAQPSTPLMVLVASVSTWHRRLGHPGSDSIKVAQYVCYL